MDIPKEMKAEIKAGIKFLNTTYGRKWREKLDSKSLDMGSCFHCMLAQTDSNFTDHVKKLKLTMGRCRELAFLGPKDLRETYEHSEYRTYYSKLTSAWKQTLWPTKPE